MRPRFLLLPLFFAAAACLSTASHADALDDIIKAKVLRVAVPQDFPPFGSVGPDMKPIGYDIDIARMFARNLGVILEMVPVTTANRIPYLNTKKVDIVISTLGKNPEREKVIDFTDAYAPFFSAIYGPPTIKMSKIDELTGKTVGVTRGAIEDLELSKIAPSTAIIKRFEDNNATISAYLSGQVPFVATGGVVADNISKKTSGKKLDFKFMIKNSPCYVGLNKDELKLKERLNAILTKAKQDGSLNAIAAKWMNLKDPVTTYL